MLFILLTIPLELSTLHKKYAFPSIFKLSLHSKLCKGLRTQTFIQFYEQVFLVSKQMSRLVITVIKKLLHRYIWTDIGSLLYRTTFVNISSLAREYKVSTLTLKVLVTTIDAQWEWMGM